MQLMMICSWPPLMRREPTFLLAVRSNVYLKHVCESLLEAPVQGVAPTGLAIVT